MLVVLSAACAGTQDDVCRVGADCASGVCLADGSCQPVDGDVDASPGPDSGEPPDGDGGTAACHPNHDSAITRDEVTTRAGLSATFRVALDTPVDTAGELQGDGSRVWDLAGELTDDSDVVVELSPVDGAWFADTFPTGDYAARLSQTEELLGVFQSTDDALLLLGVVSPNAGVSRTELVYDPPVEVLRFPLTTTSTWSTDTVVSGLAQGIAAYYSEEYDSQVDAVGELATPYGSFPVLRVRVALRRVVGAVPVTVRSFMFVSECFGTVATISSEDYETDVEFTQAAEVRRLSLAAFR